MTNTYALSVTRGKEFAVESDLQSIGLKPWVPRQLASRYVKEKRETVWYDRPYVGKVMFCVIPAIYYRDVIDIKHVIGKPTEFSRLDIEGQPACAVTRRDGSKVMRAAIPGLKDFKERVLAEYADQARQRDNSEYKCQYKPGDALRLLTPGFEDKPAVFVEAIRRAHDYYHKIRVEAQLMGQAVSIDVDPDKVTVAE